RLLPLGASGSDARPFAERLPGRGRGAYRNRHISTRLEGRVVREAMEVPTKVGSRRDSSRVPEERVWSTQRGGSDLSMLGTARQGAGGGADRRGGWGGGLETGGGGALVWGSPAGASGEGGGGGLGLSFACWAPPSFVCSSPRRSTWRASSCWSSRVGSSPRRG